MNMGVINRHTWPCMTSGRTGPSGPWGTNSVMNRPKTRWGSFPNLDRKNTTTLMAMSPKVSGPNP